MGQTEHRAYQNEEAEGVPCAVVLRDRSAGLTRVRTLAEGRVPSHSLGLMSDVPQHRPPREPALNLPGVVTALLAFMIAVHAGQSLLGEDARDTVLVWFAFIPARYEAAMGDAFPGGAPLDAATFLTYALLHGDWMHLAVNGVWMAAFGSGLARRFGTARFLAFSALCSVAGAGAHLVTHWAELAPMIGASAAVSGYMAAAARYAFRRPTERFHDAVLAPALPLGQVLTDGRILAFLGVWLALNLIFGAGLVPLGDGPTEIAWQAHIGGFFAGLLAFPLFDPIHRRVHRSA